MGKRNGLAIFALLIALAGLGLGAYSVFIVPMQTASEIKQIWTAQQPTVYYTGGSYADIPDMDITITVNTGESVMILFNGEFTADVGILIGGVRLMRDNVEVPNSRREFNIETSGGALMGYSLTANVLIEGLTTGQYEIEVQAFGVGTNERIDEGLLVIYTYT
jgi:hypothetical protein